MTITRTLFRNGDSEYAINGVPCRLLDIQELLSDTGVGRQQHVIVSQGQIDAVLNARPEERRLIIEEAAGVLKYRTPQGEGRAPARGHRGQPPRVQDLLREVRRQLRPLERQADAARRHGDLVAELAALRLHLAGREIAGLRSRLRQRRPARRELASDESGLKSEPGRSSTPTSWPPRPSSPPWAAHDVSDASCGSSRCASRRAAWRRCSPSAGAASSASARATVDQAVIATLEAEAARLPTSSAEVEAEAAALGARCRRARRAEPSWPSERAAFETEWADGVAPPSGRAAEVRGELAAAAVRHRAWRGRDGARAPAARRAASRRRRD